jgi:hypothetical protein
MTQADFEDQFMFAGISNGDVTFGTRSFFSHSSGHDRARKKLTFEKA